MFNLFLGFGIGSLMLAIIYKERYFVAMSVFFFFLAAVSLFPHGGIHCG